jgi:hypothetical protein
VCRLGLQSNYVPPNPHSSRPRFRSEKPRRDLQKLVIFVKGLKAEPLARRLNITLVAKELKSTNNKVKVSKRNPKCKK